MKKTISLFVAIAMFAPFLAFADSNITATAGNGATVSPSGTTVVLTGDTQTFTTGAQSGFHVSGVSVDGISQGAIGSYDFTGDLVDHTIDVSASQNPAGGMLWCSSPMAPGWNVSLPYGGCGAPKAPVYLPTKVIKEANGSYTLTIQ